MKHMKNCIFCTTKNNTDSTTIAQFGQWTLRLNPYQFLPGNCVLVYNPHIEGLTNLPEKELLEAFRLFKKIETALEKSLDVDRFNYLQTNNNVTHLHFHIIPRYAKPITFEGETFIDENFKSMPKESGRTLPPEIMKKLITLIQKNLK